MFFKERKRCDRKPEGILILEDVQHLSNQTPEKEKVKNIFKEI